MLKSKINSRYETHQKSRICQGDILRDFSVKTLSNDTVKELVFPYVVVLSQDCDLENSQKINEKQNQYLPNILIVPAFVSELVKNGGHLRTLYDVSQDNINSDRFKQIKQNKNDRYHFLENNQTLQIPELVLDFKIYLTIDRQAIVEQHASTYLATVNELFRESISQRFANYIARIALPELSVMNT